MATQLATGIAAAVGARRLGFAHAMFATFMASWVLVIAECICVLSWGVNASVLLDLMIVPTLVGGSIVTLPAAIIVAAVADRRF